MRSWATSEWGLITLQYINKTFQAAHDVRHVESCIGLLCIIVLPWHFSPVSRLFLFCCKKIIIISTSQSHAECISPEIDSLMFIVRDNFCLKDAFCHTRVTPMSLRTWTDMSAPRVFDRNSVLGPRDGKEIKTVSVSEWLSDRDSVRDRDRDRVSDRDSQYTLTRWTRKMFNIELTSPRNCQKTMGSHGEKDFQIDRSSSDVTGSVGGYQGSSTRRKL
jgi:hypothetical protein